jgi:hypothetical protein
MLNPTTKAKWISFGAVATQILALAPGKFNFANWFAVNLPYPQAYATYALTPTQYNYLTQPDVANLGPLDAYMLGIGPTLTTSTAQEIADRINKFVANVKSSY